MTVAVKSRSMTVAQFLQWAEGREGRYELVDGRVIAMSPERSRHVDAKMNAWEVLRNAVRAAGLDCVVKGDGLSVVVDDDNSYEPDVAIQCTPIDPEATVLDNPLVVVEVISPSSVVRDTGTKLAGYFHVGSIRHYLIIDTYERSIIKHSIEAAGGSIATAIFHDGTIQLDPPGILVSVDDLLGQELGPKARP